MWDLTVSEDCEMDPPYNPNVCAFNGHKMGVPINGCGSPVAFPFLFLYFVSYVRDVKHVHWNYM